MTLEEVAENHGLTPEGVDYALRQYQTVLCEITHGVLSKPTYDARDVIRYAQDRWCDTCELKEEIEPRRIEGKHVQILKCGNCNIDLMSGMKYCPQCGKKVKWA